MEGNKMKQIETKHYVRISKKKAEKLYNIGALLHIVPCNINPESAFYNYHVQKFGDETFEKVVTAYEIHNCFNTQTGKYAAFYIKKPGSSYWTVTVIWDTFGELYCSTISETFATEKPKNDSQILTGHFAGYQQYRMHFDDEATAREYRAQIQAGRC
jgi:hypothetical protein